MKARAMMIAAVMIEARVRCALPMVSSRISKMPRTSLGRAEVMAGERLGGTPVPNGSRV